MRNILVILLVAASSAYDVNLNELCRGILFAPLEHPTNPRLFIGCVQGKGTVLGCQGSDDIFDAFTVTCGRSEELPLPPNDVCSGIVIGSIPFEGNCELYITCMFNIPTVRSCPANTIFNAYLRACVLGNADSCNYVETTEETTQTDTSTSEETTRTEPTSPEETTQTDATTSEETTISVPSTSPTTTTTNPNSINVSFVCPESGFGNIPNVNDCSRYFECERGLRNLRDCPTGLIFDIISSQCGDPESSLCASNIRCV